MNQKKMQLDVEVSPPAFGRDLFKRNGTVSKRNMNLCLVTDRHTESNAYEPTVHTHRWAQKFGLIYFLPFKF